MDLSESFDHLKPFGYAPGNYMVRCHACDGVFDFMDKYANTCKSCAEARWSAINDEFVDRHIERTANTVKRMVAVTAPEDDAKYVAAFVRAAMKHVQALMTPQ